MKRKTDDKLFNLISVFIFAPINENKTREIYATAGPYYYFHYHSGLPG